MKWSCAINGDFGLNSGDLKGLLEAMLPERDISFLIAKPLCLKPTDSLNYSFSILLYREFMLRLSDEFNRIICFEQSYLCLKFSKMPPEDCWPNDSFLSWELL